MSKSISIPCLNISEPINSRILQLIKKLDEFNWIIGIHFHGRSIVCTTNLLKKEIIKSPTYTGTKIWNKLIDSGIIPSQIKQFIDPQHWIRHFMERTMISLPVKSFSTNDSRYRSFVHWQFQKLFDQKIIVQEKYPVIVDINNQMFPEKKNSKIQSGFI